jgi:peptidoglycan hydrolase-like protein with peptidoglycan-binding domain
MHTTRRRAATDRPATSAHRAAPGPRAGVLALQRAAGNRAVGELARRVALLRVGSSGPEVLELQMDLNALDSVGTALELDGEFGEQTAKAVREFQRSHPPLKATGIVDPETREAITMALDAPQDNKKLAAKVFTLGSGAYRRKDYAHAFDYFRRAGELDDEPDIVFNQAQSLRMLGGRRKEAIALYEQYVQRGSNGPRLVDALDFIGELSGPSSTGDAAKDAEIAKALHEKAIETAYGGDYRHALDYFEQASQLHDRQETTFDMALMLKAMGGRREEAIAMFQRFLQGPKTGGQLKKVFKALDELQDPGWGGDGEKQSRARTAFDKAAVAYRKREYGHAADYFGQAADIVESPDLLFNRAQALRKMGGARDDVIKLYEQYLASNPQGRHRADAERALRALKQFGAMP